jgi:uncharacterized protein (TIGR00297 family)
MLQIFAGFFLAVLIAYAAYRAHSLNRSGALAAILVGTVIFGVGGWQWAVLLLAFFITSSALSRAFKPRKAKLDEKYAKGGQRDAGQVFGNGGLATLFAGLWYFFPGEAWVWVAFAASLAAVNADTWATELGVLNPGLPRMITTFREVEKGTSGAISPVGTLASLAGSGLVGVLAGAFAPVGLPPLAWLWISLAGLAGSLFDSFLGATVQAIYHCPACDKETERHPGHLCGAQTVLKRGLPWLGNDLVNLGCAVVGVLLALLVLS